MSNEMTTDNMSSEEVIEVLKGIVFNSFDRTTPKERQALHLAIKSLAERPQGDLISRGVAINLLNEAQVEYDEYYKGLGKAKTIIDNAPTVEMPKHSLLPLAGDCDEAYMRGYKKGKIEGILKSRTRQQGEWIYNDKLKMFYCKDCCLLEPFTKEEVEEGVKLPNFCENCGADMRKGGEENGNTADT